MKNTNGDWFVRKHPELVRTAIDRELDNNPFSNRIIHYARIDYDYVINKHLKYLEGNNWRINWSYKVECLYHTLLSLPKQGNKIPYFLHKKISQYNPYGAENRDINLFTYQRLVDFNHTPINTNVGSITYDSAISTLNQFRRLYRMNPHECKNNAHLFFTSIINVHPQMLIEMTVQDLINMGFNVSAVTKILNDRTVSAIAKEMVTFPPTEGEGESILKMLEYMEMIIVEDILAGSSKASPHKAKCKKRIEIIKHMLYNVDKFLQGEDIE